eukprot:CAMPEP_0171108222 /NCGR_PEP_ID=MMETSP0766_2-20121228/68436_1 /TAXON_ID=439317 /ORGANISM="Gambierdiscus australes, Strain CAWD 149" /LENGTH=246 /DNA_ID=CAMNT_0011569683 /DNA_START=48 /DNA_END=785 /DNA_ORIENTATION=-
MVRLQAALTLLLASASALQINQDACACVNWREAYRTGGATCGDGHELFLATSGGLPKAIARVLLGQEFCENFYKRIDDNFCVNLEHGHAPDAWYGGQWCYVSSECAAAGPANGTHSLHVKLCHEGQDKLLRDSSPQELRRWSQEHDFDVGLLVKMAYPVDKEAKWPVVKEAFGSDTEAVLAVLAERTSTAPAAAKLRAVLAAGKPVVLDSNDGHPPFAVVTGSEAYLVELDLPHSNPKHPSTVTTW